MEKTSALIGNIYSSTNDYVRLQSKSVKLEIYERITNIISSGISASFIILFGVIAFLFINLGLAFWISEKLNSHTLGFFIIGASYIVVLGIYLIFRKKIARNSVKNVVLYKVSKHMTDYELMLKQQDEVHTQVKEAEDLLKENFEELKFNFHVLKEDIEKIKNHFVSDKTEEKHVGPKIPRIAMTSAVDFLMQHFLFKNAGLLKKTLLPLVTNTLLTSTVFKENKKTSLVENLKLKFSKFL